MYASEGTDKRDEWVNTIACTMRAAKRIEHLKMSLIRRMQKALQAMFAHGLFRWIIGITIAANFVLNCIEAEWNSREKATQELFHNTDIIFTCIFSAELLLRLFAFGTCFFSDGWNMFDVLVVGVTAYSLGVGLSGEKSGSPFGSLRTVRAMRIMR